MKRPSDDGSQGGGSYKYGPDDLPEYSKAERIAQLVVTKYRKVLLIVGVLLTILILAGLVIARFSSGGH